MFSWSELKQLFTYSPIHFFAPFSGNKIEKWKLIFAPSEKNYSPIHLFTIQYPIIPKVNSTRAQQCTLESVWCMPTTLSKSLPFCCLEIKSKTENFSLLRVKTPIHLFTYSPIHSQRNGDLRHQGITLVIHSPLGLIALGVRVRPGTEYYGNPVSFTTCGRSQPLGVT